MTRTLRYLASWFLVAGCLLVVGDVGRAQAPRKIVNPKTGQTHWTGRKPLPPETLKRLADAAKQRHGNLVQRLPKATAAVYDARVTGVIPPIRDQGQCGSCWDFSGSGMCTVAFIKAGQIPNSTNGCSEQYTLDCGQNGGCNGDDNVTVLQWCKATGLPLDKDYGVSYRASSGRCASTSALKLNKLQDYGFCTGGGNGVAAVQDIKNAIVAYGCVGTGIAAGGGWWNSGTGVDTGTSDGIDHDVIIVGWDDTQNSGRGAWIMRNSWGTSWGDKCANTANPNPTEAGYGWVAYGADGIGTEACWAVAASVRPPNPWVFGKRASLDLPRPGDVACCGNQIEVKSHESHAVLAPAAPSPVTYNATFTTTADRAPGSYGSALFGISANLPQFLPQGTYSAVLTPVGQQTKPSTHEQWQSFVDASGKRWYRYDDGIYRDGTWTPKAEHRATPQAIQPSLEIHPSPVMGPGRPSNVFFGGGGC